MNPQAPVPLQPSAPQPLAGQPVQAMALPDAQSGTVSAPWQVDSAAPSHPASIMPMPNTSPAAPLTPIASQPAGLNDAALDKVWIAKAREIMQTMQRDPFGESVEFGKLKAAYLKTRYGKDIKMSDDGHQ